MSQHENHPSILKTSSASTHHPGPLALPSAPGTKLSCIPSVICVSVRPSQHLSYVFCKILKIKYSTGMARKKEASTHSPPLMCLWICTNDGHVCVVIRANVPHVRDEKMVWFKVVDRVVCTISASAVVVMGKGGRTDNVRLS